uniref:Protein arginine N-methyltransferase n=1 Tax=Kalanchoe fedtschenkoi TaxID=63787 RepID=A0A7N0U0C4_KALFE
MDRWVLQLDREGTIFYSTAPKWISHPTADADLGVPDGAQIDWCDHWKQCVWFVQEKGLSLSQEEEIHLHASHNETAISYNLTKQSSRKEIIKCRAPHVSNSLFLSPERIGIYGDPEWRLSLLSAAQKILQGKDSYSCVVADDSVFLTILIAKLSKVSQVISLFPGLQDGAKYLQAIADANDSLIDRVKVVNKRSCLTMEDTQQRKVDLLIAEPYYYGNDGMLPWQNLRFWKERTNLDSVLSNDVKIMPCKGILKACAMSLPDLWKSRCCLDKVEGFDHSAVNSILGASGEIPSPQDSPFLPFFIWQCGRVEELSGRETVMEFEFTKPISLCRGQAKIELTKPGVCHGLVFWIEWVMDEEESIVISTGPDKRYWKQGVKLLATPKAIETNDATRGSKASCTIEASFDPSHGELTVHHIFAP